ncbi:MAG: hypothetical protein H6548_06685 [Chitinophagales bacterium]|nr:hypothetical protein [Chitinophagales bacterium]HAE35284.1 hypothetical protein [Bacteroidota bacterium]MCB9021786.1 hypothetical protein [Chitinophagales bacterium]MCB9030963.1 hypothetical protein [Chitinophagales bacterium]HPE96351.1 hypothetical protein [Chitinophagales bacterium]
MNKSLSRILMIVLGILIIFLIYQTVTGIKGPIEFDKESKARYEEVEKRLDAIRNMQFTYKEATGKYASTWDSLMMVINHDSLSIQRKILIPKSSYDANVYGPNPKLADDTTKYEVVSHSMVSIRDTLTKIIPYKLEDISIIPFSDGAKFYMKSDIIEAGGGRIKVPVFVVTAPNRLILKGLDEKYFNAEAGYQLGSLYETTTEFAYKRDGVEYE